MRIPSIPQPLAILRILALAPLPAICAVLPAQDMWIAGWGSQDIFRVSPGGVIEQRVDLTALGHRIRAVRQAPDGKLWVMFHTNATTLQFDGQFAVLDADGSNPVPHSLPNAGQQGVVTFDVAFDRAGHAWITDGYDKVFEYDASVVLQRTVQLAEYSPLGVTVDAGDNVWIAHREGPPGKVSRIDGVTRTVTIHRMPPGSQMIPTVVYADFRGFGNPSHIWVVGDNANSSDLVELDATGALVNLVTISQTGNHQALTKDAAGDIWIGDFRNGDLIRYEPATGAVSFNFNMGYPILGLGTGPFGRVWASIRPMTGRSLLRRIEPSTGTTEIEVPIGTGVLQEADSRFQYVHVVDPTGDADGDNTINVLEIDGGTSPFDPCSTPLSSLSTSGSSRLGATLGIEVAAPAGAVTAVAMSVGQSLLSPGLPFPNVACSFRLDPATLLPFSVTTIGTASLSLPIPGSPALSGLILRIQGLTIGGAAQFSNVASVQTFG